MLSFGMDELKRMPVSSQHVFEKELDAAVADTHGGGRPLAFVFTEQEIILKFLFSDQIRCFTVVFDQHPDSAGVAFLCGFTFTGKLQGSHGLLKIVFHHRSPLLM